MLGLALLLGACSSPDVGFSESSWRPLAGPWLPGSQATGGGMIADSVTVQRVRGGTPDVTPVQPESGDVWPAREVERATLMSGPDEAMRNIPNYSPSLMQGAPPARSPVPTPGIPGSGSPGGLGTTSRPLPPAQATPAQPPSAPGGAGIGPEGQVRIDPSGRPVVTTGQAGRVSGTTSPQGGGAVIRDGNVETYIGPDGQVRTRVVAP